MLYAIAMGQIMTADTTSLNQQLQENKPPAYCYCMYKLWLNSS